MSEGCKTEKLSSQLWMEPLLMLSNISSRQIRHLKIITSVPDIKDKRNYNIKKWKYFLPKSKSLTLRSSKRKWGQWSETLMESGYYFLQSFIIKKHIYTDIKKKSVSHIFRKIEHTCFIWDILNDVENYELKLFWFLFSINLF